MISLYLISVILTSSSGTMKRMERICPICMIYFKKHKRGNLNRQPLHSLITFTFLYENKYSLFLFILLKQLDRKMSLHYCC